MAETLLFDAQFDSNEFNQGVDGMIGSLKRLENTEKEVASSLAKTQVQLEVNAKSMSDLEGKIANLDKKSDDYKTSQKQLTDQLKQLQKQEKELLDSYKASEKELTSVTGQIADLNKAYAGAENAVKSLQEQTGKPLAVSLDSTNFTMELQKASMAKSDLLSDFDFSGFEEFRDRIAGAGDEIEVLKQVVDEANQELQNLQPGTQEFEELSTVVREANSFIEQYDQTLDDLGDSHEETGEQTLSLRTRLRNLRDELARMEDVGQDNTEEYKQMQLAAAQLEDQYGDLQQRIRILASDTGNIDFGLEAVTTAAAGYEGLVAGMDLLGLGSEDTEKAQRKLLAVMALVQASQQISNALNKDSILLVRGRVLADRALAATQGLLSKSFLAAAAGSRAFSAALITTGVGALVVAVGVLIKVLSDLKKRQEEAKAVQEAYGKTLDAQAESVAEATVQVEVMRNKFDLAKEGVLDKDEVLKDYNESIGETVGQAKDLNEAEQLLIDNADTYIEYVGLKARASAAAAVAQEELEKSLRAEASSVDELTNLWDEFLASGSEGFGIQREEEFLRQRAERRREDITETSNQLANDLLSQQQEFVRQAEALSRENNFNTSERSRRTSRRSAREISNIYEQELRAVRDRLEELNASDIVDEQTIEADAQKTFDTYKEKLEKAVADGKLTEGQENSLLSYALQIRDSEVSQAIDELNETRQRILSEVDSALDEIEATNNEAQVQLIRDRYERENSIIRQALLDRYSEIEAQQAAFESRLLEENRLGLISDENYSRLLEGSREQFSLAYELANAEAERAYQEVSFNAFQNSLNNLRTTLDREGVIRSESITDEIQEAASLYLQGELNYQEYQEELTRILKQESDLRKQDQLDAIDEEIRLIQERISEGVSNDQLQQLTQQIFALRAERDRIERDAATSAVDEDNAQRDARLDTLVSYTDAIGGLAQEIVGFWQAANEAEQRALERSISIQDRRVEAARRIAERGNAEYLRLEEDRQRQLLVQQENAARRQIAVNAALQASQLLVAVTGAIAKIATPGVGTIEAISNIGIIVGALASGYALVESLQSNQPSFFGGDPFVRRDFTNNNLQITRKGEPKGRDTIAAWLHEGEAVTSADKASQYRPTLKAIHEGSIPPKLLNSFATTRSMPLTHNYKAFQEAVHIKVNQDRELSKRLDQNNRLLERQNELLENLDNTEVKMDEHGLSVRMVKTAAKLKKSKRK